jgi:hypothetical protein
MTLEPMRCPACNKKFAELALAGAALLVHRCDNSRCRRYLLVDLRSGRCHVLPDDPARHREAIHRLAGGAP